MATHLFSWGARPLGVLGTVWQRPRLPDPRSSGASSGTSAGYGWASSMEALAGCGHNPRGVPDVGVAYTLPYA